MGVGVFFSLPQVPTVCWVIPLCSCHGQQEIRALSVVLLEDITKLLLSNSHTFIPSAHACQLNEKYQSLMPPPASREASPVGQWLWGSIKLPMTQPGRPLIEQRLFTFLLQFSLLSKLSNTDGINADLCPGRCGSAG